MADQSKAHLGDRSPDVPRSLGFAPLVRHIALVGVAGLATGFVVAGGGGRLLMRVAAIAGPDSATGRLTESGFNVGEITLGGTVELVLFVGLFAGGIGAVLYLIAEPWLDWAGKWRGVTFGAFLVAVGSATSDALDPDNFDFRILGNEAFIVAMFVVLFLLYGVVLVWLSDELDRRFRDADPVRPLRSVGGHMVLAVLGAILFLPPTVFSFVSEESCGCDPPRLVSVFVLALALATVLLWVARYTGRLASWSTGIRLLGIGALLGAGAAGTIRAVGDISAIL